MEIGELDRLEDFGRGQLQRGKNYQMSHIATEVMEFAYEQSESTSRGKFLACLVSYWLKHTGKAYSDEFRNFNPREAISKNLKGQLESL